MLFIFSAVENNFGGEVKEAIIPQNKLIEAMQSGGHILYMRHAKTNHEQKDKENHDIRDCTTQRNLSAEGRAQAESLGKIRILRLATQCLVDFIFFSFIHHYTNRERHREITIMCEG